MRYTAALLALLFAAPAAAQDEIGENLPEGALGRRPVIVSDSWPDTVSTYVVQSIDGTTDARRGGCAEFRAAIRHRAAIRYEWHVEPAAAGEIRGASDLDELRVCDLRESMTVVLASVRLDDPTAPVSTHRHRVHVPRHWWQERHWGAPRWVWAAAAGGGAVAWTAGCSGRTGGVC